MREFFSLSWLAVRGKEGRVATTKIATSAKTPLHHQNEMRPGRGGEEVEAVNRWKSCNVCVQS